MFFIKVILNLLGEKEVLHIHKKAQKIDYIEKKKHDINLQYYSMLHVPILFQLFYISYNFYYLYHH